MRATTIHSIKIKEVSFFPDTAYEDTRNINVWREFIEPNSLKTIIKTSTWQKTIDRPTTSDNLIAQTIYRPTHYMRFFIKESERVDYISIANDIEVTPADGGPYKVRLVKDPEFVRQSQQFIYLVTITYYKIESDPFTILSPLSSDFVANKFTALELNKLTFSVTQPKIEFLGSKNADIFASAALQEFSVSGTGLSPTAVSFNVGAPGLAGLVSVLDAALVTAGVDSLIETFTVGYSVGLRWKNSDPNQTFSILDTGAGASDAVFNMGWEAATRINGYAIDQDFYDNYSNALTLYTQLEAKEITPEVEQLDENTDGENLPRFAGTSLIKRKSLTFYVSPEQLKALHHIYAAKLSDISVLLDDEATTLNFIHKREILQVNQNDNLIDLFEVNLIIPYESSLVTNYFEQA